METSLDNKLVSLGINKADWDEALSCEGRICLVSAKNGTTYWLKKKAPARGFWRYKALNLISRLMRLPLLKAVPQKGNTAALATEAQRIKTLSAHGITVPELIWQDKGFLLLSHIGGSVVLQFKAQPNNTEKKRALLTACLNAINNVHQKNQHLSQAFVRNMVQVSQHPLHIGFIDFEDDPIRVMSLAEAQARDLLLFVDSVARFFLKDIAFFRQAIVQFMQQHDQEVIDLLSLTAHKLQWVTKLPFQKALGHDYEKLKLGLMALRDI